MDHHRAFRRTVRERAAAESSDDGTNDTIVSEVVRRNKLQVWFLAEHVIDMPLERVP